MKSDVIVISSEGNNMEAALNQIDKITAYKELSKKDALSLRLLTEEMMAMMRAITGNVNGEFWIEDHGKTFELHLTVTNATIVLEVVWCTGNIKELTSRNTVLSCLCNLICINRESMIHNIPYSSSVEVEV